MGVRQTEKGASQYLTGNKFPCSVDFWEGSPSAIEFEYLAGDSESAANGEVIAELIILGARISVLCAHSSYYLTWIYIVRPCCEI